MNRRGFLGGLAAAGAPIPLAQAQEGRIYRVAVISPASSPVAQFKAVVIPELARLGFSVERNLSISYHVGPEGEMPRLAAEAVATRPEVAVAATIAPVRAMLKASDTIPIVMSFVGDDPIQAGFAQSYAKPGGRVTGLTNQSQELDSKRLSILKEVIPGAKRIAALAKKPPRHVEAVEGMKRTARDLGVDLFVANVDSSAEYMAAFSAMKAEKCEGLVVVAAPDFLDDSPELARLALEAGLPTIGEFVSQSRDGFTLGYGVDREAFRRRTAPYVARILRGASPGDLPIERPTVLEFAVNLKSARALGIEMPQQILLRADEVIE
jgi:putative ABC transport system substrate-binding protein